MIIQHHINCWQYLKTDKPQRKDEKCLGVKAAKAERIICSQLYSFAYTVTPEKHSDDLFAVFVFEKVLSTVEFVN